MIEMVKEQSDNSIIAPYKIYEGKMKDIVIKAKDNNRKILTIEDHMLKRLEVQSVWHIPSEFSIWNKTYETSNFVFYNHLTNKAKIVSNSEDIKKVINYKTDIYKTLEDEDENEYLFGINNAQKLYSSINAEEFEINKIPDSLSFNKNNIEKNFILDALVQDKYLIKEYMNFVELTYKDIDTMTPFDPNVAISVFPNQYDFSIVPLSLDTIDGNSDIYSNTGIIREDNSIITIKNDKIQELNEDFSMQVAKRLQKDLENIPITEPITRNTIENTIANLEIKDIMQADLAATEWIRTMNSITYGNLLNNK